MQSQVGARGMQLLALSKLFTLYRCVSSGSHCQIAEFVLQHCAHAACCTRQRRSCCANIVLLLLDLAMFEPSQRTLWPRSNVTAAHVAMSVVHLGGVAVSTSSLAAVDLDAGLRSTKSLSPHDHPFVESPSLVCCSCAIARGHCVHVAMVCSLALCCAALATAAAAAGSSASESRHSDKGSAGEQVAASAGAAAVVALRRSHAVLQQRTALSLSVVSDQMRDCKCKTAKVSVLACYVQNATCQTYAWMS